MCVQAGEHPVLSQPAQLDLHALLALRVVSISEATLFGERPMAADDLTRPALAVGHNLTTWRPTLLMQAGGSGSGSVSFTAARAVGPLARGVRVQLQPMQVRAFFVTVQRGGSSGAACVDPPTTVAEFEAATVSGSGATKHGGGGSSSGQHQQAEAQGHGAAAGAAGDATRRRLPGEHGGSADAHVVAPSALRLVVALPLALVGGAGYALLHRSRLVRRRAVKVCTV